MPKKVEPDLSYLKSKVDRENEIVYDGQPICSPFVTENGHTVYTCFLTIYDYKELVKCSEQTARRAFAKSDFPSFDFGKTPLVEVHAFMDYIQRAHNRKDDIAYGPNVIDMQYMLESNRKRVFDKLCEPVTCSSGKAINACFLTVNDVAALTGLGISTVYKLFNMADFPTIYMARKSVVEIHAFVDYFLKPHKQCKKSA